MSSTRTASLETNEQQRTSNIIKEYLDLTEALLRSFCVLQ